MVQLEMLKLLAKALEIGYVIVQMRKMVLLAKGNVDSLSQYHDLHIQAQFLWAHIPWIARFINDLRFSFDGTQ